MVSRLGEATHVSDEVWPKRRISFKDELRSNDADIGHKELFGRFHAEIRRRHYSRLTEKSYEDWIRRFLIFHDLKPPLDLGTEAVKAYLEYLAEKREVAANTQNK